MWRRARGWGVAGREVRAGRAGRQQGSHLVQGIRGPWVRPRWPRAVGISLLLSPLSRSINALSPGPTTLESPDCPLASQARDVALLTETSGFHGQTPRMEV